MDGLFIKICSRSLTKTKEPMLLFDVHITQLRTIEFIVTYSCYSLSTSNVHISSIVRYE